MNKIFKEIKTGKQEKKHRTIWRSTPFVS